jgi:hypothetical protein
MANKEKPAVEKSTQEPKKRPSFLRRSCLTCLGVIVLAVLACVVLPFAFSRLGIFGQPAERAYSGAPDPFASSSVKNIFETKQIAGVKVYVMPVTGKTTAQAFLILDASQGYQGTSPNAGDDTVFTQVISDLVNRDRSDNLGLERVTIEYRDEEGLRKMAFTIPMDSVIAYADGSISRDEFFGNAYFDITDSLGNFGLDAADVLDELGN